MCSDFLIDGRSDNTSDGFSSVSVLSKAESRKNIIYLQYFLKTFSAFFLLIGITFLNYLSKTVSLVRFCPDKLNHIADSLLNCKTLI